MKRSKGCIVPDVVPRPVAKDRGDGGCEQEAHEEEEAERDVAEIYPDEVRCGVSEWEAFGEVRTMLEGLVSTLEQ